jgi:prevent-host-death family protein
MSDREWNVAQAKGRLSEVLRAAEHAPQYIGNRGREVAVVLGVEAYRSLQALQDRAAPRERLAEFLRFSEQLRRAGGAAIRLPRRRPRRSPFAGRRGD